MMTATTPVDRRKSESWEVKALQIERDLREKIRRRERVSKNVHVVHEEGLTFGQRVSDKLADVAGSWNFIFSFALVLVVWVMLNTVNLVHHWDKYPFILLNLFLSMLAAIQAPVIMMSQNRQEERDRIRGEHDYEVNLKAEMEIGQLHEKLDTLREQQWQELLGIQQRQIDLLEAELSILKRANGPGV